MKWLSTIKISLNINEQCNKQEVNDILETKGGKSDFNLMQFIFNGFSFRFVSLHYEFDSRMRVPVYFLCTLRLYTTKFLRSTDSNAAVLRNNEKFNVFNI